jgi:hypothetical protein
MQNSTSDIEYLAARVEKLERQNRLFKRAGLALLLLPAALLVMGQARPSGTIVAQGFVLTDANGIKKAELSVPSGNKEGTPVLRFFNSDGEVNALLSAKAYVLFGAGARTIQGDNGPVQMRIQRVSVDYAGFHVWDESGKALIDLGELETPEALAPSASLKLYDSDERQRIELGVRSTSESGIWLFDAGGQSRAGLGLTSERPYVRLSDSDGFSAQMGSTDLVTPSTGEQHKTSAASLTLFGKDNTVLWSAP